MKFAVLSDLRYISPRMIASPEKNALSLRSAVAENTLRQAAEQADVIFIVGDLTDSGDKCSHEDLAAFLQTMKAAEKKVCVSFASHDCNHHGASVAKYGTDEQVEALKPGEIVKNYADFGYDEALSVHPATASYCVALDDTTRCLMLNNGLVSGENGAAAKADLLEWIGKMKADADKDGKLLFVCSPKPLFADPSAQNPDAVFGKELADMGITLAFTGHSHFRDAIYRTGETEKGIYNVSVPGVRFYPPAYISASLDGKEGKFSFRTVSAELPDVPGVDRETLKEHYKKTFREKYQRGVNRSGETVKKVMDTAKVKDVYPLVREKAKLTEAEYAAVKDKKLLDVITDTAFSAQNGKSADAHAPESRILKPLCEKLDSLPAMPQFADIRDRYLDGGSLSQMMDPVMCGGFTAGGLAGMSLMYPPAAGAFPFFCSNYASDSILALICGIALFLSFIPPVAAAAGVTAMGMGKNAASTVKRPAPTVKK